MAWWDILTGGAQGVPFGISPPSAGAAVGQAAADPSALEGQLAQRKRTADMTDYMLTQSPFAQALMAPVRGFEGVTDVITGQAPYQAAYPDGSVRTSPQFIGDVADVAGSIGVGGVGAAATRPGSSLGIFGGRMAKNAPLDDLTRAEAMEQAGQRADDIWRSTGWGRGADGDWRFEIDDSKAGLDGAALDSFVDGPPGTFIETRMGAFEHPELYNSYDFNGPLEIVKVAPDGNYGGVYHPSTDGAVVRGKSDEHVRSILLHELQHGVQSRENFARGGSFNQLKDADGFDLYRRTAGEVEARNVQTRRDFTKEERRRIAPWETEDVPREHQIVRKR
jgi:hypothetical protein